MQRHPTTQTFTANLSPFTYLSYTSSSILYHPIHPIPVYLSYIIPSIQLLSRPGTFRNLLRFEPDVFIDRIAAPLFDAVHLPRGYLLRAEYQATGTTRIQHRCQISKLDRLIRFFLRLRGVPFHTLSYLYDQHEMTCRRDFFHIAELFMERLEPLYVQPIIIGSAEYLNLVGANAFRHFPSALYAADVVECSLRRPDNIGHGTYYSGYKRQYTYQFLCCVDSKGICRHWHGHYPGSCNDIESYYYSELYRNPQTYLGPGDKILADGIFGRVQGANSRFIVPIGYMQRRLTPAEERYNIIHRWDRVIVEHYFARLKLYCPFLDQYNLGRDKLNLVFSACVVICNVLIKFQSPLRR